MNRIDTAAIRKAAEGNQSKKIAVSKKWLRLVADELDRMYKANQFKDTLRDIFKDYKR